MAPPILEASTTLTSLAVPLFFESDTLDPSPPLDLTDPSSTTTTYIPMSHPEDMIDPWRSNADFLTIILTHTITFIVGVIGNCVVLATWARGGKIRSPTATFLVSLACADLLLLIIFLPLETLEYFVITWDRQGHICKLSSFVELLSGMSSVLNLVAVSVERFLVIVYPIQARRWCTVSKSRRSLVLVWVLAIILAAPPVFNKSTYSITYFNETTAITAFYCFEKDDRLAVAFSLYELSILFVLPAMLMIFCYFRVMRELWASTRVITVLTSASAGQYQKSTTPSSVAPKGHDSRSYLVRWPNKKAVAVNVEGPPEDLDLGLPVAPKILGATPPHHRSSISSSGVSSSSTSKANKIAAILASSPQPSDGGKDSDPGPPDSPIAGTLGPEKGTSSSSSKLCKLFYCLHSLRTLLWLRPCCCCCGRKSTYRKRSTTAMAPLGAHRAHHRCHRCHRPAQFKARSASPAGIHPPGHHHHLHYHHRTGPSVNGMSYQQIKSCCLYKTHCAACSQGLDTSVTPNSGPVESEKMSSVSCSSGTCATSTSNGIVLSPTASVDSQQGPSSTSRLLLMVQQAAQLCFCSCCRAQVPKTPLPPSGSGTRSPYELRYQRGLAAAGGTQQRPSTRPSYTMTSSFTNLNTTAAGASTYNMLAVNVVNGNGPLPKATSLSVNSMAVGGHPPVTSATPSISSAPAVYHHSTGTGYRAPVTDVRNARKQLYCQVIKMLLFIVILFHICWGPRLIFNVFKSTGIGYFNNVAYNARVYFYLLSFIHSALNPFVYGFMSSNFRRMMLNSCNHHHRHRHTHRHYNSYHIHNSTCPGLPGTANSLMDAINTTSCLNMAHLKAGVHNGNLRRSTSDLYEPEVGSRGSRGGGLRVHPRTVPSEVSVYGDPSSGGPAVHPHRSSIESDDGQVSYGEIELEEELQAAVKAMSSSRLAAAALQAEAEGSGSSGSRSHHFLDQLLPGRSSKTSLHRSSSLFFSFGRKGGNGSRVSLPSSKRSNKKMKWSEKLLTTKTKRKGGNKGCGRCRAASAVPRVSLPGLEHSF